MPFAFTAASLVDYACRLYGRDVIMDAGNRKGTYNGKEYTEAEA